jgi:hypothetical protein
MKQRDFIILGFLVVSLLSVRAAPVAFFMGLACACLVYVYVVN